MNKAERKAQLYDQVARIGKALSSPRRIELLDLLSQAEKTVEELANELTIDIKLASAHLKALREARLVVTRRRGKHIIYSLSGDDVPGLIVAMRHVAEQHLLELQVAMIEMSTDARGLVPVTRKSLLAQVRCGDVILIDVRPKPEYEAGHLPCARSMPLTEIQQRLSELPTDKEIVAYCRGPFCLFAEEAVLLLIREGRRARSLSDGISEWQAAGLPVIRPNAVRSSEAFPAQRT